MIDGNCAVYYIIQMLWLRHLAARLAHCPAFIPPAWPEGEFSFGTCRPDLTWNVSRRIRAEILTSREIWWRSSSLLDGCIIISRRKERRRGKKWNDDGKTCFLMFDVVGVDEKWHPVLVLSFSYWLVQLFDGSRCLVAGRVKKGRK